MTAVEALRWALGCVAPENRGDYFECAERALAEAEGPVNSPAAGRFRQLAADLALIPEEDFAALAGITMSTCKAWRDRGRSPAWLLLGNRYYFPRSAVVSHLSSIVREHRTPAAVKDLL
jgi:hypothetical protein